VPVVTIELFEGRTAEQKSRLSRAITDDMIQILEVQEESVIIVFHDLPRTNFAKSGVLASERKT